MVHRIEIISKVSDTRAEVLHKKLTAQNFVVKKVSLVDVYTIDKSLTNSQLQATGQMLINPLTQNLSCDPIIIKDAFYAIEIGFLPGVTDNVANTIKEMVSDLLKIKFTKEEGIYTSQVIFLKGQVSQKDITAIAASLYNPVIQMAKIKSVRLLRKDGGMGTAIPKVRLTSSGIVTEVNLDVTNEQLIEIGKKGIANEDGTRRGPLALDLDYLLAIKSHFKKSGRSPTDVELESIAQTWSEHCKHTIFANPIDDVKKGLFDTYIKGATEKIDSPLCVSVFTDNSGAIEFDKDYLITHKVETHNSPSALDPFGGAITGIGGVNRDCLGFGLAAKPIVNTYGFCFADPKDSRPLYKGPNFTQKMLTPGRIMNGVIAGVNSGGNCSGIPTPQGFMFFNKRYKGKPLVFVGTAGLIPNKKTLYRKKAKANDLIVMIGGRVGLDGIHGATFSSEAMDSGSPATAVQIGDPITQKKLSDALVKEARDQGLYHSITDNGAGGLSCSVAEMAKECGGCFVELDKVPVKYPGLSPWQIWISESQERMTLAVPKNKWRKFKKLMFDRGVEATVIGKFSKNKKCVVVWKNKKIMDVDMEFLHNGLPKRKLQTVSASKKYKDPILPKFTNLNNIFLKMLQRFNIAGFEFISRQYDHEVQATSVIKPLHGRGRINTDTTVVRPVLSSFKGIVLSQGLYPTYSEINPYNMAVCATDTAVRNLVTAGADISKLALLDNFCWCSSTEPERLWQLKQTAKGCFDIATNYKTPFISGKDSMFNDFKGFDEKGNPVKISVPPTLLVSSIAVVDDIRKTISIDVKFPGDLVYLLGETHDELGGSEYFLELSKDNLEFVGNNVPAVNFSQNLRLYRAFYKAIQKELIASSIGINRGGLGIALAKTCLAGMLGMEIDLKNLAGKVSRDDFALFSESQGRIIVTIDPKSKTQFEKIMQGTQCQLIGEVTEKQQIVIHGKSGKIGDLSLKEALNAYKTTFKGY